MADYQPIPVKGYIAQSPENVALANEGKELEERVLRWLEKVVEHVQSKQVYSPILSDAAFGNRYIKTGFMWSQRAIFNPQRIPLPEDKS